MEIFIAHNSCTSDDAENSITINKSQQKKTIELIAIQ